LDQSRVGYKYKRVGCKIVKEGANRNVGNEDMKIHMSSSQWKVFYSNEGMSIVTLPMDRIFTNKVVTLVTFSFERFIDTFSYKLESLVHVF